MLSHLAQKAYVVHRSTQPITYKSGQPLWLPQVVHILDHPPMVLIPSASVVISTALNPSSGQCVSPIVLQEGGIPEDRSGNPDPSTWRGVRTHSRLRRDSIYSSSAPSLHPHPSIHLPSPKHPVLLTSAPEQHPSSLPPHFFSRNPPPLTGRPQRKPELTCALPTHHLGTSLHSGERPPRRPRTPHPSPPSYRTLAQEWKKNHRASLEILRNRNSPPPPISPHWSGAKGGGA